MRKGSFVFHFEYIEDIPAELQGEWAIHIINYARDNVAPEFTDWRDVRMWNRIKERIDEEKQKYEKRCSNLKNSRRKAEPKPQPEEPKEAEKPEEPKAEKPKAEKFAKPTTADVKAYATEKGYNVDADKFVNYYESNGWKVGKNPMKNWKAAVANWAKNSFEAQEKPGGTMWGNESSNAEDYASFF